MRKIDVEELRALVGNALDAEWEYRRFVRNKREMTLREWDEWYWAKETASSIRWDGLASVCRMLGLDMDMLVSVEKSIRRKEARLRWERCFRIDLRTEESYLRAISL